MSPPSHLSVPCCHDVYVISIYYVIGARNEFTTSAFCNIITPYNGTAFIYVVYSTCFLQVKCVGMREVLIISSTRSIATPTYTVSSCSLHCARVTTGRCTSAHTDTQLYTHTHTHTQWKTDHRQCTCTYL